jgi:hypothetical protein
MQKYPKLPELWDIQDKCRVEQPDMTKMPLIQHSSYAGETSMYKLAVMAMGPDALNRYSRALYTVETLVYLIQAAKDEARGRART